MTYTKPEVAVLGEAVSMIEQFPYLKNIPKNTEPPIQRGLNPAYDLDD